MIDVEVGAPLLSGPLTLYPLFLPAAAPADTRCTISVRVGCDTGASPEARASLRALPLAPEQRP